MLRLGGGGCPVHDDSNIDSQANQSNQTLPEKDTVFGKGGSCSIDGGWVSLGRPDPVSKQLRIIDENKSKTTEHFFAFGKVKLQ